jgi:5'-3' exonuclease
MQKRLSQIDADSIIFILAWHNKDHGDERDMELQLDQFMVDLITETQATHYVGAFTPPRTFRDEIYPQYKANRRKGDGPPQHIKFWKPIIKKLCTEKYGFFQPDNLEADDILSILRKVEGFDEVIFCSPDKDIRQIPGKHYDYSKKKWEQISADEAARRFWMQMLTGDSTDNIPGCKGIGPVGAEKLLSSFRLPDMLRKVVLANYVENRKYKSWEEGRQQFDLMHSLLTLQNPTQELVAEYSKYIQEVAYSDAELNIEQDGVFQDNQRSHTDDVLRPSADLPQQV